jgi:hypothetical protein
MAALVAAYSQEKFSLVVDPSRLEAQSKEAGVLTSD